MRIFKNFLISLFVLSLFLAPAVSFATHGGIVPHCDQTGVVIVGPPIPPSTQPQTRVECTWGFNQFMELINNVISFVLFRLALPIAAILFAYAGFLLLTSGGSEDKRTKAKEIFTRVAIGLVVAAAAWLIVNTILSILGFQGAWIGFKP